MDVLFPENNELKLLASARAMGTSEVMLVYPMSDRNIKLRSSECKKLGAEFGIMVKDQKEVQQAKALTKNILARAAPWVFDDKRVRYVTDMEAGPRKDFTHHRNSGLNQVFINKCLKHGKTLLVNANLLMGKRQELILGRMMQNNRFYRKYGPDVLVVSGASSPLDIRSERDLQEILKL